MTSFQGLYTNGSAIQAAIVDLYADMYVTQLMNQSSARRRQLLDVMLGTTPFEEVDKINEIDVDSQAIVTEPQSLGAPERFLSSSTFSASQIGTLIFPLSTALSESNRILLTALQVREPYA
jgi:hypothetical protein